jgi:hypothetical protein
MPPHLDPLPLKGEKGRSAGKRMEPTYTIPVIRPYSVVNTPSPIHLQFILTDAFVEGKFNLPSESEGISVSANYPPPNPFGVQNVEKCVCFL